MSAKGKEEALGTRIASLIINFISKAPVAAAEGVPAQQLNNTFTACMRRASMASTHTVMRASQAAALYVLRLLAACEESSGCLTAPLVAAALERVYAQKKSRLTHGFFCTIMERMPVVGGASSAVTVCLACWRALTPFAPQVRCVATPPSTWWPPARSSGSSPGTSTWCLSHSSSWTRRCATSPRPRQLQWWRLRWTLRRSPGG